MKIKTILTITVLLYIATTTAQPLTIKRLGIEQGLSNNYVVSITQDKQGFLWFATESGLNKFDGSSFRTYKKYSNPLKGISGNELNKVYADKFDDIVWIATQRAGLNAFDYKTETFTAFNHDDQNRSSVVTNDITDITNAGDGNLWIATYHGGVDYYDKKTKKFTHYNQSTLPSLASNGVWSVTDDGKGHLYIGHVSAGLSVLSLSDKKIRHFINQPGVSNSLPGNEVRSIYIDRNDNVWIGTNNGLALFNPDGGTFVVFRNIKNKPNSLLANVVFSIKQMDDNRIWIGTENGGISILDIRQGLFLSPENVSFENIRYADDQSGLSNPTVRSIYQDSFHNIWIGTYGGGVNFVSSRPQVFNTWSYSPIPSVKNRLNNKVAWGICADSENHLWIGTDGGGINYFVNGENVRTYKKENGELTDNAILSAIKDSEGNLWFGTFYGGANFYNSKTRKFSQIKIGDDNTKDFRCFYEDGNKNMWMGTNKGLHSYNLLTKEIKTYTTENSALRENFVRAISQDERGRLWIGTFGEGLYVFEKDMKLVKILYAGSGFCSNTINHIFRDSKGRMWIATGEGLALFSAPTDLLLFKVFTEKDGLANNYVRAITEDAQHNIWISTNAGISRYSPEKNKFYNYNHFDGIPMGDFMSGSVTKTSDGTIYFGSQNGVSYFNPLLVPTETKLSPTIITGCEIYDNQIALSENETVIPVVSEIKLNHKQNTFRISFDVLDYSLNHQVEYIYMLKGLEDSWYNTQGENSVTFRNLSPGTYEFKVKARIKNQEWTDNITSMKITISPPFWLTWWAKGIYTLLAIAILFFIIRFYKRKLMLENSLYLEKTNHLQEQELNNERLRFYTNITHELRTPLTLILGPLEDMLGDTTLSPKQIGKISIIHQSAARLLNLINQILEFRKTETQNKKLCVSRANLADLIREIGVKYKELNRNKNISFSISIESEEVLLFFDREIITIILDNLISNAIKYTEEGEISLILRAVEEEQVKYTEIEVRDTGHGISAENLPLIFDRYYQAEGKYQVSGTGIGLALVKNLVAIHEGRIFADSKPDEGTSFRVQIITNNIYPDALHDDTQAYKQTAEIYKEPTEAADAKRLVLVVEDNADIRDYIKNSLSDFYDVITVNEGQSGLEAAYTHIPDIIISDIMMPIMDGMELCKTLKGDVRTSHIPVILLTAKDTLQDKTEGYTIGADSYITKPFSGNLLHSRVSNLLESRRKIAEQVSSNTAQKKAMMIESLSKLDNEFIEKITAIIEKDLDSDKIDVAYIADQMFMSHSTLYRKVKALTGMTANEFIRKVKIRNAERMLLTGKYTISEVAYSVGMNSVTYFRQCFKEEYGVSPSEYIKHIKEGKG